MNYDQAIDYIHRTSWRGSKLGLERTIELLGAMGNPEKKLKFIHISGTNGKGSVSAMLASVLKTAGYKTGLYTSPYIVTFNERMQINGVPIENNELAKITSYVARFADKMNDPPTEFELITAVSFEFFYRNGCDIVVLETGMGGEFDSTNVIDTPELAVITAIDLDHVRELGPTMRDIASAKAGIIKQGGQVLFYGENSQAEEVIVKKCKKMNAQLTVADFKELNIKDISTDKLTFDYKSYKNIEIPLIGTYQFKNTAFVLSALDIIIYKGRKISEQSVKEGLFNVKWPGRFEILRHNPLIISDGGHNPQGIKSAIESFKTHFPDKKAIFVIGMMADKDIERMVELIAPVASEFIAVTPNTSRAMPADELKNRVEKFGITAYSCDTVLNGLSLAVSHAGSGGIVFNIGTLYMYNEVLSAVRSLKI